MTSCATAPCTGGISPKDIFELKAKCNQLGAELDKTFVGQYRNLDDDDQINLLHHVFLSHYNVQKNACYVFLNRTYPDHFIEYVIDASSNQEELQATTNKATMNAIYRWYDPSNKELFFSISEKAYLAKFEERIEPEAQSRSTGN